MFDLSNDKGGGGWRKGVNTKPDLRQVGNTKNKQQLSANITVAELPKQALTLALNITVHHRKQQP